MARLKIGASRLVWTREWTWETGEHGRKRNTKTIQVLAVVERFAWRSRIARARALTVGRCWCRAVTSLGWVGASEPGDNDEEVTTTRCKELPRSTNQKRFFGAVRFIKGSMHDHDRSSIFIKVTLFRSLIGSIAIQLTRTQRSIQPVRCLYVKWSKWNGWEKIVQNRRSQLI